MAVTGQISKFEIMNILIWQNHHLHITYYFSTFIVLLIFSTPPRSIRVGLPCGQFQGLAKLDKLTTYLFIYSRVKDSPTFVAYLQALIAHMLANLSTLLSSLFSVTIKLKYSIPSFRPLKTGDLSSLSNFLSIIE